MNGNYGALLASYGEPLRLGHSNPRAAPKNRSLRHRSHMQHYLDVEVRARLFDLISRMSAWRAYTPVPSIVRIVTSKVFGSSCI